MKLSWAKKQRGEIGVLLIIILLMIIIGLIVWYALVGSKSQSTSAPPPPPKQSPTPTPVYQGWKSYDLKFDGLNIKIPADWSLKDYSATDEYAKTIPKSEGTRENYVWTSPSGLKLSYLTHISGIGGACISESDNAGEVSCPNVNILASDKILTKNNINFYLVKEELTNFQSKEVETRGLGIVANDDPQYLPKVGIKNEFPPYLLYYTKKNWASSLTVSVPTLFGGNPTGQADQNAYKATQLKTNLSTTDFFKQTDWITADLILRSLQ